MSQNTSETPRTDELTIKHGHSPMPDGMCYSEMKLLARQLERELNEANKGAEMLKDLRNRIRNCVNHDFMAESKKSTE